jgi:hypothetical protein
MEDEAESIFAEKLMSKMRKILTFKYASAETNKVPIKQREPRR